MQYMAARCAYSTYHIPDKIPRRIFRDFTLKQTFCGINFTFCVLIFRVCALILTILRISVCELHQIVKNAKF